MTMAEDDYFDDLGFGYVKTGVGFMETFRQNRDVAHAFRGRWRPRPADFFNGRPLYARDDLWEVLAPPLPLKLYVHPDGPSKVLVHVDHPSGKWFEVDDALGWAWKKVLSRPPHNPQAIRPDDELGYRIRGIPFALPPPDKDYPR